MIVPADVLAGPRKPPRPSMEHRKAHVTLLALVEAFRGGELTRDELFAATTKLLSATPALLNDARAALNFDASVRSDFEGWLASLRESPTIALGGRRVTVTAALISALDAADGRPLGQYRRA